MYKPVQKSLTFQGIFAAFILLQLTFSVFGQKQNDLTRNWKPDQGKYNFSLAYVWTYNDEFQDINGDIKIYVDTLSGTFLFTDEAYGMSDDAEFILAFQNGVFISGYRDDTGKKMIRMDTLENIPTAVAGKEFYDKEFARITKATGEKRVFGKNDMKWPVVEGERYRTTFDTPGAFSDDFLVKTKFHMLLVYYFNQRQSSARLQYNFSGALPMDYLLLQTAYESDGKKIEIVLKSVMPTQRIVDISGYKK